MATRSSKPASKSRSRNQKDPPADAAPVRICLVILGLTALSIGLPATFAPETFYTDYPFFTALVKLLPPYNEHLITDVGGLYIGFGMMFGWAAFRPRADPPCTGHGWRRPARKSRPAPTG